MSTLIIGGLLVIGILALVSVVFVARSEPRSPKASATRTKRAVPKNEPIPAESSSTGEHVEQLPTVPQQREEQRFPVVNGQFHELSVGLHALHGQAQELEQRLNMLTNMIEHIERPRNGHLDVEEEQTSSSEVMPTA